MKALVTGASSGIGKAIARELAEAGYKLVLVARSENALRDQVAELPGEKHEALVADLTDDSQLGLVIERLLVEEFGKEIDVLVHSAGMGLPAGGYLGNPVEASLIVNELSIDVQTKLVHAALPGMIKRGTGGVLTVGSIAGFLPGTPAITYSASKAWAQSFGEGLNHFLKGSGVKSTVVAPGFVRSEFHSRLNLAPSGIHNFMWCTPEEVARSAVKAFNRGRALVVPGAIWKMVYTFYRLVPRSWSRAAFAKYMDWTGRRSK